MKSVTAIILTQRCSWIKTKHRAASLANRPGEADTAMCRGYVGSVKVNDAADKDGDCCGACNWLSIKRSSLTQPDGDFLGACAQDLTPASRHHTTSASASAPFVVSPFDRSKAHNDLPAITSRARRCRLHRMPPHVRDDRDTSLCGTRYAFAIPRRNAPESLREFFALKE